MGSSKRFILGEITGKRILTAGKKRIQDIPHALSWQFGHFANENKKRIEKYNNIHHGERCFIVANGPSLKNMNLQNLQNEISFGLNRIYLNFENSSFRPTYYVAANDLVVGQFYKDIEKLPMPKFLNYNLRSLFNPQDDSICFLRPKLVLKDTFQNDLTKAMVFGGTVTYVTLQIAFYMGFKEVVLIGLDHNYVEKGTPNEAEIRKGNKDESHFHPQYFPKGVKWQLPDLLRSEMDYQIARDYYESNGKFIFDATIGGKCQIFEKKDFTNFWNND